MSEEKPKGDITFSKIKYITLKNKPYEANSNKYKKEKIYKDKKYLIDNKILFGKIKTTLLFFNIIYLYNFIWLIGCQQRNIQSNDSSITLKTFGIGNIQIISEEYSFLPDRILINGINHAVNKVYNLENSENNITLIWDNKLTSTSQMFKGCSNIIEIDFTLFDTSNVNYMNEMFSDCSSLVSLDLSNFNTSNVERLDSMFYGCFSLTSLDLSYFNSLNVEKMENMFQDCSSLISLDLSYFNTSNVKKMENMFNGCSSLTYLNLSKFITSNVVSIDSMFYGCSLLTSLDLSNFDLSKVESVSGMFYECSSLASLDLSNFNTSNINNMEYMFYGCSSLTSLDLSNFNTSQTSNFEGLFSGCSSLIYLDISNLDSNKASNIEDMFSDCSSLEFINLQSASINENIKEQILNLISQNITICNSEENLDNSFTQKKEIFCENIEYNYESFQCFMNHYSNKNNKYFCNLCGKEFFQLYNDEENHNSNITCYKSIKGYYLDKNDLLFKRCYISCKTCEISGNETFHNCLECNDNYIYEYALITYKNCYETSSYDVMSDTVVNSNSYSFYSINNSYLNNSNDIITEDIINEENEPIQNILDSFFKELDLADINNGFDKKIDRDNLKIIFTTTENQKNNEDEKNITINFGQCENILRNEYNISSNDSLYILLFIYEEEGMKIPKVEYELYYPLYSFNNLTKLNLSLCEDRKIEISISVAINDTLDKYNPKSDYYNNICTKATSKSGTDIILKDRQNEFVDNNMTLCEENCELVFYNYTSKKVTCSCEVKVEVIHDNKFNKKEFFKSFIDIKNMLNLNVMKCYKTVMKIKDLLKNYGCYIILSIILIYFITLIIFCLFSFYKLQNNIKNIISALKSVQLPQFNNNDIINKDDKNDIPIIKIQSNKKRKKRKRKTKIYKKINKQIDLKNKNEIKEEINEENFPKYYKESSDQKIRSMGSVELDLVDKNKILNENILQLKDFEINSLDYEEALILDKRNFLEYYISSIKYNHPLIFSFAPFSDYNSRIIKIFLFFFSIGSDFIINTLFFDDDTMHKIYIDKGKFNFLYQLPQIIYSTIISRIIDAIIKNLALSQDNISQLKQEKQKEKRDFDLEQKKLIRKIKIKFILFFIIDFMILLFFWYYITCFCGIYVNTQTHLIKDSFISFSIGLLFPFVFYLVPGIFRISALRAEKQNRKCMYKLASFIENYLN